MTVHFGLLPKQPPHPFSPSIKFLQPLLVNEFCPLDAKLEVEEVQLLWPPPDPDCFYVRQA